jgi:dihydroxyacetone kinase-like protein
MKKLINDPRDAMQESLAGFAEAHSDILKVSFDPVYMVRADANPGALIHVTPLPASSR